MKIKKATYRITGIFIALLMVLPIVFISMHMLFHNHNELHKHNLTTVCDKKNTLCKYDNYTFNYLTTITFFFEEDLLACGIFKKHFFNNNTNRHINLVNIKKGRAPPY